MRFFLPAAVLLLIGVSAQAQQAAKNVNCDGCVNTKDLANLAVGPVKLKNSAVTTQKMQNGAVTTLKLRNGAVGTAKLKNGTVSSEKIRDGAVTLDKVGPALRNDINTECAEGEVVVGKDGGGRFLCEALPTQVATPPQVVLVDSEDTVLPFELERYGNGPQTLGFLQVPGGVVRVRVYEAGLIDDAVAYYTASDCSGAPVAAPAFQRKLLDNEYLLRDGVLYQESDSEFQTTNLYSVTSGELSNLAAVAENCTFQEDTLTLVSVTKVADLPYAPPYRLEMR